jgi:hypothetical protein
MRQRGVKVFVSEYKTITGVSVIHAYQLDTLSVKEITKLLYLLENLQLQYVHILKQQETMMGWEQTEEKFLEPQFNMLAASFSFSEERKKSYAPDRLMSVKPE